jgi:hypothetical protein
MTMSNVHFLGPDALWHAVGTVTAETEEAKPVAELLARIAVIMQQVSASAELTPGDLELVRELDALLQGAPIPVLAALWSDVKNLAFGCAHLANAILAARATVIAKKAGSN